MLSQDLFSSFDRVYVISLARRPDRLAAFQNKVDQVNWPFKPIEVFKAIDGEKCAPPSWFQSGGGAWGCLRSHSGILERCLNDGVQSVLILEDDCYWVSPDTFSKDAQKFLNAVPDWECLFIGGQHHQTPVPIRAGVVKCNDAQRTHAYALRGKIIGDLYRFWADCKVHCDWNLGKFTAKYRTYAPEVFLLGQDEGRSDISGADNPKKAFIAPSQQAPVIWLKDTSREVVEALRTQGYHFGRCRDDKGRDVGLNEVAGLQRPRAKIHKLKEWITLIDWESTSMNAVTAIWHPDLDQETVQLAAGDRLRILENPTIESAVAAIAGSKAA